MIKIYNMRKFKSGAIRDEDLGKIDYEGHISPIVVLRYGEYMNKHRVMKDGSLRPSDNWQKGFPKSEYLKSAWRHFMDLWLFHRGFKGRDTIEDAACGVLFNIMGYLFEILREKK